MSKKKQSNPYPIYVRNSKWIYYCLLSKKEAIRIQLFGFETSINHYINDDGTWMSRDKVFCEKISKTEFKKAFREARKILQEQLKRIK